MQLSLDLPLGNVTVSDKGLVHIYFKIKPPDYSTMCVDLAGHVGQLFFESQGRTPDEFEVFFNTLKNGFVNKCDYESAAMCRDSTVLIKRLTEQNEALRERIRLLTLPTSTSKKDTED